MHIRLESIRMFFFTQFQGVFKSWERNYNLNTDLKYECIQGPCIIKLLSVKKKNTSYIYNTVDSRYLELHGTW